MPVEVTNRYVRVRVRDPEEMQEDSFRTITLDDKKGIKAIIAKPKGSDTTVIQSYLFALEKGWTTDKALEWVRQHHQEIKSSMSKDYIIFGYEEVTKNITANITKSYIEKDEEGVPRKYFEVVVSGTRIDRDGEKMSEQAIAKLIRAYKSGKIPLFSNHGRGPNGERVYDWRDILAKSVDAYRVGPDVVAKFQLNEANPDAIRLWKYIHEEKMPVAFSIGAKALKKRKIRIRGGNYEISG